MFLWGEPVKPKTCGECGGMGVRRLHGAQGMTGYAVCLPCDGKGVVKRPMGPVDAMEEECSRG